MEAQTCIPKLPTKPIPRTVVARVENTDACWYIGSARCLEDLAAGSSNAAPVLGRLGVCGMLLFQTLTGIRTSSVQNSHAQWLSQGKWCVQSQKGESPFAFISVIESTLPVPYRSGRHLRSLQHFCVSLFCFSAVCLLKQPNKNVKTIYLRPRKNKVLL